MQDTENSPAGTDAAVTIDTKTFKRLLNEGRFPELQRQLSEADPSVTAGLLMRVPPVQAGRAFSLLPRELAVRVFDRLDSADRHRLLSTFSDQDVRTLLEAMPPDDRAEILYAVPVTVAERLIKLLSPEQRQLTLKLLGYKKATAGREMMPSFIDLRPDMTVEQALGRIRRRAGSQETIYVSYVIDDAGRILGAVPLKDLVLAAPGDLVADIMRPEPVTVSTDTDREQVAKILRENNLIAVPVVDNEGRLVGIITQDDVADILEQEATEDIYKLVGVSPTEKSYFASNIFSMVGSRILWLTLLIMFNTITGIIIAGQQAVLSEVVILAAFIPLLVGTGGNVGAQSSTIIIRGLATGEIKAGDLGAIVAREAGIGVIVGVILAALAFGWAYVLGRDLRVSVVVAATVVAISIAATVFGGLLPFVVRLFRVDPALLSAPLLTTIMDVFGVGVFFLIARLILQI